MKKKVIENMIIIILSLLLIYLLISLYFDKHFFINTTINGADVSLKAHNDAERIIRKFIEDYDLQLVEKDGKTEVISGQSIGMQFNEAADITKISDKHNSFRWIRALLRGKKYYMKDLYVYNKDLLKNKIDDLNCINREITEPHNPDFVYNNGCYEVIEEVDGNKINKDKLSEIIQKSIGKGTAKLDLVKMGCYEKPMYTTSSEKTQETVKLLNKYASAGINYDFGSRNEILDGNIIREWLHVDDNLDVVINKTAVTEYVNELSQKYDTVGAVRNFQTSTGINVEVKGGLYGWKINQEAEIRAILDTVSRGENVEREPVYKRKALSREENDIGNTYVEINITRQYLWFYKEGKLIVHGSVVTGNPNKGNATVTGTYMLNYKRKGETLSGAGYEVKVSYWMPFYGNTGIHDATWRYAFGGEIYKRKGTHGCVNTPLYLAKTLFENIEEGTPIICYKEKE
jgi:vancomycin resistance protein YoaR